MKVLAVNYSLRGVDADLEETYVSTRRGAFKQGADEEIDGLARSVMSEYLRLAKLAIAADFDVLVFLANGHGGLFGRWARVRKIAWWLQSITTELLVRIALRKKEKKLIVVDLIDYRTIARRDAWFLRRCFLYFKRELASDVVSSLELVIPWWTHLGLACRMPEVHEWTRKLRPISLGIAQPPAAADRREKRYDVFYTGNNCVVHFVRLEVERVLRKLRDERDLRIYMPKERITPDEFAQAIAESFISISPSGMGWDCFRHYEVAAGGAALVLSAPTVRCHQPFRDGEHCRHFLDAEDLEAVILELLADKDQIARFTAAAREHTLKWHTFRAIREYILGETRAAISR